MRQTRRRSIANAPPLPPLSPCRSRSKRRASAPPVPHVPEPQEEPQQDESSQDAENDQTQCDAVDRLLTAVQNVDADVDESNKLSFPQDYFSMKGKKKGGKKLTDIDIVDEQELRAALAKIVPKHEAEVAKLLESYKALYKRWRFQLRCGFGLLMYGFGSKRKLLEDFALAVLTDGPVVVANGYLPTMNMKHLIFSIANALWQELKILKKDCTGQPSASQSLDDLMGFLCDNQQGAPIYVLVHNVDGPSLRDDSTQQLLAKLAALSQVFFVASIDNVNAPLLWDKQMANRQFNWWWTRTPTYAPYDVEGKFLPLILAASGVNRSARSASLVLQNLTPNAQSVFKALAEHQMAHPEDQGLTQHQLYTTCRERFLVSSELTLRAHLTEFKDHQLVKVRRGNDGQDCLFIPLSAEALSKILQDIQE